jgi:hypothetical protein
MISLDINPALKTYLALQGFADVDLYPMNAYRDYQAPFITWIDSPSTRSAEEYWLKDSILTYYIYDNDLSRAKNIAYKIEEFLNIGDNVLYIKTLITNPISNYRLCWSKLNSGSMSPALEREGLTCISRVFDVGYIPL